MQNYWKKLETLLQKENFACFEQFLLLSQCSQKLSASESSKSVCICERVKKASYSRKIFLHLEHKGELFWYVVENIVKDSKIVDFEQCF